MFVCVWGGIYAAGALCPLINPEHIRSSSFIVSGEDPGSQRHTRKSNRRNRS